VAEEKVGPIAAMFAPMAQALVDLSSTLSDEQLDAILNFTKKSNEVVAEHNARLRAGSDRDVSAGGETTVQGSASGG
jgi:hypothetical protein